VKLLLDQNLSVRAAEILRAAEIDALHAGEVGLDRAEDTAILQWCRDEGRIAVTFDADFHAILALSGAAAPSTIRIRIEGLDDTEQALLIRRIIAAIEADLLRGCAATVTVTTIRVHRLPISAR
jgi:predicted nuclease of predicted toxin-antitoxin system